MRQSEESGNRKLFEVRQWQEICIFSLFFSACQSVKTNLRVLFVTGSRRNIFNLKTADRRIQDF